MPCVWTKPAPNQFCVPGLVQPTMGPQPFPGFTARADTDESRVAAPGGCTVESVWPLKAAHRSSAFNGSPLPRWPVLVAEEWPKRSLMAPSNELGSGHSGAKVLRLRVTVNPKFARRTVFIVSALDPVDIGHMEVWSNVWWLGADEGQWAAHFQPPPPSPPVLGNFEHLNRHCPIPACRRGLGAPPSGGFTLLGMGTDHPIGDVLE